MKLQISFFALAVVSVASFCPVPNKARATLDNTALQAKNEAKPWFGAAAMAAVGWTLAAQVAMASPDVNPDPFLQSASSSSILALGVPTFAPEAPQTYDKLDFSLPSYGSSSYGFGQGTETRLEKAGGTEVDKQKEAMRKAEEARKERLAEKRAAMKRQELADKERAKLKQAEGQERVKALFK